MRKSIVNLLICFAAVGALACGCGGGGNKKADVQPAEEAAQAASDSVAAAELTKITMEKIASLPAEPVFEIVTSMGVITVKLYADTPRHRENFAKLALEKYYDGVLFHRVIPDFMIQTGDPLSKDPANKDRLGTGGPDYTIPAEIVPGHTHKKGALAAARRGDAVNPYKESSGSQFYIVQSESGCLHLDGEYTVFGETLDGFDVIDSIAAVQTGARNCPVQDVKIITIKLAEGQDMAQ